MTIAPHTDAPPPGPPVASQEEVAERSTVAVSYEDEVELDEMTSPIARILVSAQAQTDRARVRRKNEDSVLVLPEYSVFAVADGMGGYAGGDVASALAVQTLKRSFEQTLFDGKVESEVAVPQRGREMACAIQMANRAILEEAHRDPVLSEKRALSCSV